MIQSHLPQEISSLVNPSPAPRDFLKNNKRHKVLIAVIDTGVDYNLPAILDNLHFDLDFDNKPLRLGWDFVGKDRWPSPYIGRQTFLSGNEATILKELIHADSGLKDYLDPRRNVIQEFLGSVWHGTSVAGLIAQGRKDLGLLVYRVSPPDSDPDPHHLYHEQWMKYVIAASRMAIDDGARVITITGFIHFDRKENLKLFEIAKYQTERFREIINAHQNILFIVCAANASGYRFSGEETDVINFPSGIVAKNMLVVGSLSENGTISEFSSMPTGNLMAVFAPGEKISTIYPQNILRIPQRHLSMIPSLFESIEDGNESIESVASNLRHFSRDNQVLNSGTSFSMALVAKKCAELLVESLNLTPSEIVENLIKSNSPKLPARNPVNKVLFKTTLNEVCSSAEIAH